MSDLDTIYAAQLAMAEKLNRIEERLILLQEGQVVQTIAQTEQIAVVADEVQAVAEEQAQAEIAQAEQLEQISDRLEETHVETVESDGRGEEAETGGSTEGESGTAESEPIIITVTSNAEQRSVEHKPRRFTRGRATA